MTDSKPSGQIKLENDAIVYSLNENNRWRVLVSEVRCIGAYTTADGPFGDDYFLVFLTKDLRYEASYYAAGRIPFLLELGVQLHHELHPGLDNSANLNSRVMWPPHLENAPLFDITPELPTANVFVKLRQWIFPRMNLSLTSQVQNEIGN